MTLGPVKAAAIVSATLVLAGVVLQRAVVLPREASARAELLELEAEVARRAEGAAFETPDLRHPFLRRMTARLDQDLFELKSFLPESRDAARDGFLAELRGSGAWSVEVESLEWSDRSSGGALSLRHSAGHARVRISPSGQGWLETVRHLQSGRPVVTVDCVDVPDLSDPSSPVTLEVTLYARSLDLRPEAGSSPSAGESRERRLRWAGLFPRPAKTPLENQDVQGTGPSPVLASMTRGDCYGSCPVYSVVVHEDGIVDYDGQQYVKTEGKHHYRIGMDRVRALEAAFDAAGFSAFAASYENGPMEFEVAQVSHRGKAVSHREGDEHAPPSLTQLEDDFDQIVGTEQWIGTPEEREVFRHL